MNFLYKESKSKIKKKFFFCFFFCFFGAGGGLGLVNFFYNGVGGGSYSK